MFRDEFTRCVTMKSLIPGCGKGIVVASGNDKKVKNDMSTIGNEDLRFGKIEGRGSD